MYGKPKLFKTLRQTILERVLSMWVTACMGGRTAGTGIWVGERVLDQENKTLLAPLEHWPLEGRWHDSQGLY